MHIPDNFLSPPVWGTLDVLAAPVIFAVSRQAQKSTDANRLPLMGVMGAFVFAAQMINFPVAVGTSGHLIGGTLLACVLGPAPAALVLTAILAIQAFVFQDGGVLALGANIFNMAIAGVLAGYLPARALSKTRFGNLGIFAGGFCSVLVSGVLAMTELLLSGIRLSGSVLLLSLGVFAVNAILEGAITVSVLRAIERLRPDKVEQMRPMGARRRVLAVTAAAALVLVVFGVFIASAQPDRIQQLAARLSHRNFAFEAPLADYQLHLASEAWVSHALAGLCGLLLVYLLCSAAGSLIARRRRSYST